MAIDKFTTTVSRVVPIPIEEIDTDQIIPKQFLKRIERTGFGQFLFFDWRFKDDGSDNPEFELNQPAVKGATVLVARRNFGSGSSREWGWRRAKRPVKLRFVPMPSRRPRL